LIFCAYIYRRRYRYFLISNFSISKGILRDSKARKFKKFQEIETKIGKKIEKRYKKFNKEHYIDSVDASFDATELNVFDFNEISIKDKS
jgi:hypothetical protein